MNKCFLIGKIKSDIEYKFIINSKNTAIAYFYIELLNKSIIKIKAYNDLADKCYSKLNKLDNICIIGYLESTFEIVVEEIYIL